MIGVCIYLSIFGATYVYFLSPPLSDKPLTVLFTIDGARGPIPKLLGAESSPLRARAKDMVLSTSVNWISNFIIAFIHPSLALYYLLWLDSPVSWAFLCTQRRQVRWSRSQGRCLMIGQWTVAQHGVEGLCIMWRFRRRVSEFRWRGSRYSRPRMRLLDQPEREYDVEDMH